MATQQREHTVQLVNKHNDQTPSVSLVRNGDGRIEYNRKTQKQISAWGFSEVRYKMRTEVEYGVGQNTYHSQDIRPLCKNILGN